MATTIENGLDALVLVDETRGVTIIPQLAELRRLNWFDGKLLRADDLRIEQDHVRALVRRANRAGGYGPVQGLGCTLAADGRINVGPGMAVDPGGRTLLLPTDVALDVQDVIDRTAGRVRRAARREKRLAGRRAENEFADCVEPEIAAEVPVGGARYYVLTVGWAEALCGNEEVYGRLCEDACTTSTDRPWRIDGLVFRAHPLQPRTPLATSAAVALTDRHERSLLASALFADELVDAGSLVFGDGLRSSVWCAGAAPRDAQRDEVPLAVFARAGGTTRFLDIWIARRERIEPPQQRYWAGRLAMRPWDAFLAQVLQFQCQLADLLAGAAPAGPGGTDPCTERQRALEDTFAELERRAAGEPDEEDPKLVLLRKRVVALRAAAPTGARRILVDGGVVELPPAGYLPVDPGGPPSVEDQVRALMGGGVDLTFCATRHDAVARAFEDAQHLDRISLLRGLDDPARREDVEVIVPDAELEEVAARDAWDGVLRTGGGQEPPQISEDEEPRFADRAVRAAARVGIALRGAGRVEHRGPLAVRWAGIRPEEEDGDDETPTRPSAFGEVSTDRDPFALGEGEELPFSGAADIALDSGGETRGQRASFRAVVRVHSVEQRPGGMLVRGVVDGIAVVRQISVTGEEQSDSFTVSRRPAQLLRRRTEDGGTLTALRVQFDEDTIATVTLEWHGEADSVELVAYVASLERDREVRRVRLAAAEAPTAFGRELARLTLDREPGAATPGHPARAASEEALKRIERAVREPGYAEDARHRLFPGFDDAGVRLRPTRDWVLFRRRAPLRCGPVAPVVTAIETFAVYGFAGREPVITTHVPAAPEGFAYVGEVAFAEGSVRIVRGVEGVVRVWDDLVEDGVIYGAGVVAGAPGGDELGRRRVDQLVDALAVVTPRGDEYQTRILDPADVPVDPRGADGVLLVAFVPTQQRLTSVAYRGVAMGATWDKYVSAVIEQNYKAAIEAVFENENDLGTIRFPEGSAAPVDDAEREAVVQRYWEIDGIVTGVARAIAWSVKGDEEAGAPDLRSARTKVVVEHIGNAPPELIEVDEETLKPARDRGVEEPLLVVFLPGVMT